MKFILTNDTECNAALLYFAHFHDAYVATLTLRSHYETSSGGEFLFPGFDVIIVFAHSGYAEYNPPTRTVRAEFLDASCFQLNLKSIESGMLLIDQVHIDRLPEGAFEFGIEFLDTLEEKAIPTKLRWKPFFQFEKAIFSEE